MIFIDLTEDIGAKGEKVTIFFIRPSFDVRRK